jgi:PAS domain-containing protein
MALAASRGGNCEIDDHGCAEAQPDETAAVALSALNNLNRAVAVVGPDSRMLFSNPLFGELFGGDGRAAELRDDGKTWFNLAVVRLRLVDKAGAIEALQRAAGHPEVRDQAVAELAKLGVKPSS